MIREVVTRAVSGLYSALHEDQLRSMAMLGAIVKQGFLASRQRNFIMLTRI